MTSFVRLFKTFVQTLDKLLESKSSFVDSTMEGVHNWSLSSEPKAVTSVTVLAETSIISPRKLFIFIIYKKKHLDQSIQKVVNLILKKETLTVTCTDESATAAGCPTDSD